MYFLIYVSSASGPMSNADLEGLLAQARRNNTALGITGMLLYKDGNFMQLLEGSAENVGKVHEKILKDSRHRGLITLLTGEAAERNFQDWSMGFRDLRTPESQRMQGYSDFMNTPLNDSAFQREPSRAKRLLLTFKQSM